MPKGGFLPIKVSMRCGSHASRSSMLRMPALTNFRTPITPMLSICFICNGLSSQILDPRLRSNSNALCMLTESPRAIWQSMTHLIRLLTLLKTSCVSKEYCCRCLPISPSHDKSAAPRTDWMIRETLCAGRSRLTGIANRMEGDLFSDLYNGFSPARNRILENSDACARAES
jgi:hypothetical protein